jgi:hypothetical protein
MANVLSVIPTFALLLLFASATSAPLETTKTSALSAAEKASATHFTALSARDWRRIAMDAQKSSISALLGQIYFTRKRTSGIIELRDDEVGQQAVSFRQLSSLCR